MADFSDQPRRQTAVGIVASFDFNQDRELWRWAPEDVSLFIARTDPVPAADAAELVSALNRPESVARPTREVCAVGASVVVFTCTACSFTGGLDAELALRRAMLAHGAPQALTTAGASAAALHAVDARRVAIVHPYTPLVGGRLRDFLTASGLEVVTEHGVPRSVEALAALSDRQVAELVRAGDSPNADAIFVSCTATPTYDVIAPLEQLLGKPVITANQASVWSALRTQNARLIGPGQSLAAT